LKKASVLGQYFHLEDVIEIFQLEEFKDIHSLVQWIEEMDKFRFLTASDESSYNFGMNLDNDTSINDLVKQSPIDGFNNFDPETNSNNESKNTTSNASCGSYYFRHITVMNAIYDSQPFNQRAQYHLQVALFFEDKVNDSNAETLMPLLSFHYSKTRNVSKNIYYFEKMGYMYCQKSYWREAQNALERLLGFLDTKFDSTKANKNSNADQCNIGSDANNNNSFYTGNQLRKINSQKGATDRYASYTTTAIRSAMSNPVGPGNPNILKELPLEDAIPIQDPTRHADWMAHLAFVLVQLKDFEKVIPLCLTALKLTGVDFPTDEKVIKKQLLRTMMELWKLWRKTKGGVRVYEAKKGFSRFWEGRSNRKVSEYLPMGQAGHYKLQGCDIKCFNCPKVRRVHTLCYRGLSLAGLISTDISVSAMGLLLFKGCTVDIKTGPIDNGEWIMSCYRGAFGLFLNILPLSNIFLKQAMKIEGARGLRDKTHPVYHIMGYTWFAKGEIGLAYKYVDLACDYYAGRGDLANLISEYIKWKRYTTFL
jgi:hypothetical protein